MKELKTIVAVKNINGTSYVGVREYTNEFGEKSNQTIIVGANWGNVLKNDLDKMLVFDTTELEKTYSKEEIEIQKNKIIESLKKRTSDEETKAKLLSEGDKTIVASKAQNDAYTHIYKGLKIKDNKLYISGLAERKTILEKGTYPIGKPKTLTATIKSEIEKAAKLRSSKFRTFTLENASELAIKGIVIDQKEK